MAMPLLLLACLSGCHNQYSMETTESIYKNYGVRIPDIFVPGTPIPDKYTKMDVPVCTIPNEEAMWVKIKAKAGIFGGFVSRHYTIDRLELLESRMKAVSGTFETFNFVKLGFKPVALDGTVQPPFELGEVSSEQGLGNEIVLVPPVPVDLVQIMRNSQANTTGVCPLVAAEVHGLVPTPPVAADVSVHVKVTVTANGFFASIAGWFMQLFM